MIRVFKANDRDFSTNGDLVIVPIKARVKNNRNGDFTFELTCESKYNEYLVENDLLLVPTPQGVQPFRINSNIQKKGNRLTLKCKHVFYDSANYVIADSYAVDLTCKQALNHFNNATDNASPFTMDSNINTLNTFRCVRKSLLEAINTVIERWGGYLVRDGWKVAVYSSIGVDNGVTIQYKKNLQEMTATYDWSNVATKVLPVGKDGILLPELYVYSSTQYEIPYTKVISIDQDIDEDNYPSHEAYVSAVISNLRVEAQNYVNKACEPVVTYSLKGKPEVVSDIGDIIHVEDQRIGVNLTTQVIAYEWDVITESYVNLTFGNFGEDLGKLLSTVNSSTKAIVNEEVGKVKGKINDINNLLWGSYVVYRGYDILVCDSIPYTSASKILRFSNNGISISTTGVSGTFASVYDLDTQRLTVPAITLNGSDLATLLQGLRSDISDLEDDVADLQTNKQDKLTAGENITIEDNVISATGGGGGGGLEYWFEADSSSATNPMWGYTDRTGSLYGIYGTMWRSRGSKPAKDPVLGFGYNVLFSPYMWQSKNNSQYQTVESESYYTGCCENIGTSATLYPRLTITNYGRIITNNSLRAEKGFYTWEDFYYITNKNMSSANDFVDGCGEITATIGLKQYFQRMLVAGNNITLTQIGTGTDAGKYRIDSTATVGSINGTTIDTALTSHDLGIINKFYLRQYNQTYYRTDQTEATDSNGNVYIEAGSGINISWNNSITGTTDKLVIISSRTNISPALGMTQNRPIDKDTVENILIVSGDPTKPSIIGVSVEFKTSDGSPITDGVFKAWVSQDPNSETVLPYNSYPASILKDVRSYIDGESSVILKIEGLMLKTAQTSGSTTAPNVNVKHSSTADIVVNASYYYYSLS